ncbi:MAG: NAD(P)-dependent oxidoreductase [Spirochaetia bacterium]
MGESRARPPDLEARLEWARRHMPLTEEEIRLLPPLEGVRLACSIHLEPKVTASLEGLRDRGASLFLTTCNPATVRDDVVKRLQSRGAVVHAWRDMSPADAASAESKALEWRPTHLWEMGASLTAAIVARGRGAGPVARPLAAQVAAAMESTGSGIARLRSFLSAGSFPGYPVFNCDEVPIKEGLHNRYLVGQTTWQAFTERTMLGLHRKRVLVVGYGQVGRGVALTARALGGAVSVAEQDPARALEARYDGFPAGPLDDLVGAADVVVTATGGRHVVAARHLAACADGCILMNVGHAGDEIEVEALVSRREVLPFVEEARAGGKTVYLFAGGSMANLTAGQGDTLNSFDITMAAMLAGVRFTLSDEAGSLAPGLHPLPRSAWEDVARRAARG